MKEDEVFQYHFDNAERIGYLIASFIKGTLTPLERKELDDWILQSEKNELLFDELTSEENIQKTMEWYASLNEEKALSRVKKRIAFRKEKRPFPFALVSIAASVTLIIGIAIFYQWQKNHAAIVQNNGSTIAVAQDDPLPGKDKAILTIAGGKQIVLDSAAKQKLEGEKNITLAGGTILYNSEPFIQPSQNMLTVPRGGQYKIVLPDGTKVWLNAESSLSYPTAFTGNERKVVLTGEGYFEVSKNKEKPFIVESPAGTVKVLGTHFNINNYGDENVLTATLLEGSVEITKAGNSKILKPGQQARVTEKTIELVSVDTREAVAWKEGNFLFRNTPVHAIVKQLERWYDLDIEFRDSVEKHLNATISRDVPLSNVLHYLEETGDVHFKREGKKLIVMK